MKIGILTDTHVGNTDVNDDEVFEVIERISEGFHAEGVNKVVHLGDAIHEKSIEEDIENLTKVRSHFKDFEEFCLLFGNHDIINIKNKKQNELDWTRNGKILSSNRNRDIILVDTVKKSKYPHLGFIDDHSIELIKKSLESGHETHILSHFPLQYTNVHSDTFDIYPELAFPINKVEVQRIFTGHRDRIHLYNGHLHPDKGTTVSGEPLGLRMNLVEPVLKFSLNEGIPEPEVNTSINVKDLIFEF